jgi:AcrR family transcriptional regulator
MVKASKARGGRPSREQAGKIEDRIFAAAATVFFSEGYGAASIEEIARRAHISKRTFYARFENKPAVFRAVVQGIIKRMTPTDTTTDKLFEGKNVEEVLRRIAPIILNASLSSDALSLQRVILAEATRFPELALIMEEQGMRREAIRRIADLLTHKTKTESSTTPAFAAEQFIFMLTAAPQRRALGLGTPLGVKELGKWANDTVDLFLKGY